MGCRPPRTPKPQFPYGSQAWRSELANLKASIVTSHQACRASHPQCFRHCSPQQFKISILEVGSAPAYQKVALQLAQKPKKNKFWRVFCQFRTYPQEQKHEKSFQHPEQGGFFNLLRCYTWKFQFDLSVSVAKTSPSIISQVSFRKRTSKYTQNGKGSQQTTLTPRTGQH